MRCKKKVNIWGYGTKEFLEVGAFAFPTINSWDLWSIHRQWIQVGQVYGERAWKLNSSTDGHLKSAGNTFIHKWEKYKPCHLFNKQFLGKCSPHGAHIACQHSSTWIAYIYRHAHATHSYMHSYKYMCKYNYIYNTYNII